MGPPNYHDFAKPALDYWCAGCHTDPTGGTACAGGRCFGDDPCVLAQLGCCTKERPYLTCEMRAALGDAIEPPKYTVAECGVWRFEITIDVAQTGTLDAIHPEDRISAGSAAMGFLDMSRPESFSEDIVRLRAWADYGYALPDQCDVPTSAPE